MTHWWRSSRDCVSRQMKTCIQQNRLAEYLILLQLVLEYGFAVTSSWCPATWRRLNHRYCWKIQTLLLSLSPEGEHKMWRVHDPCCNLWNSVYKCEEQTVKRLTAGDVLLIEGLWVKTDEEVHLAEYLTLLHLWFSKMGSLNLCINLYVSAPFARKPICISHQGKSTLSWMHFSLMSQIT